MESPLQRASEAAEVSPKKTRLEMNHHTNHKNTTQLIDAVKALIIPFIQHADESAALRATGASLGPSTQNALIKGDLLPPAQLHARLRDLLPSGTGPGPDSGAGRGKDGLLAAIAEVLTYSVNTWDQGFLDKLYSSPTPVGLVSELLLAALNTNVHVYSVSPALTVLEKLTARRLAALFGFDGPRAGGVTAAGGSASNLTSMVIARNTLFPETKTAGNAGHPKKLVAFTSAHGHYSVEKAAGVLGLGTDAVVKVPVDASGRMDPAALAARVQACLDGGRTPFYVNATAGTTVLGSYDPFAAVAAVCRAHRLWLHVDASWGGPVVFSASPATRGDKLAGVHLADSVTVNPHKMMNVPVTCSFLLGPDLRVFHAANRIDAPYLFHGEDNANVNSEHADADEQEQDQEEEEEVWDLADLTLQCGRRGDALKLALSWVYHGPSGFAAQVDHAFAMARLLATELQHKSEEFTLVSENPPPCLQVCFYHRYSDDGEDKNTRRTVEMVKRLRGRGFMVDYASFPPPYDSDDSSSGSGGGGEKQKTFKGSFFRVVVNVQTRRETVLGLVTALEEVGREVDA